MSENSKIEWCHHLSAANGISTAMALCANRLHVQPARAGVSAMVVVLPRRSSAVKTRQRVNAGESPFSHRIVDGVPRLAANVIKRATWRPSAAATRSATGGQSVTPERISAELGAQPPSPTPPTELLPGFDSREVNIKTHAASLRRDFQNTLSASHVHSIIQENRRG